MQMRLLADENLHAELVRWLGAAGHDVLYAAELMGAGPDSVILWRAQTEQRIVLTDDKDFGELVYRQRLSSHGIVYCGWARHPSPSVCSACRASGH